MVIWLFPGKHFRILLGNLKLHYRSWSNRVNLCNNNLNVLRPTMFCNLIWKYLCTSYIGYILYSSKISCCSCYSISRFSNRFSFIYKLYHKLLNNLREHEKTHHQIGPFVSQMSRCHHHTVTCKLDTLYMCSYVKQENAATVITS